MTQPWNERIPRDPISSKEKMYELLERGSLGNTIPMWTNLEQWGNLALGQKMWGVRTMAPGGPCRLWCPVGEVSGTFREFERSGYKAQISAMVSGVTMWAEVWPSPSGLVLSCVENPPDGGSWRQMMPTHQKHFEGTAARLMLSRHLNPNSRDDLMDLLDLYPGHVVEFLALDHCLGTIPHRNAIIWEVRNY